VFLAFAFASIWIPFTLHSAFEKVKQIQKKKRKNVCGPQYLTVLCTSYTCPSFHTYSFSLALDFEAAISSQLGSKRSSDRDGGFAKGSVWYNFMSSFTSSFTTSIAKQPTLCPTLWSASLKTHSHRVKHMVKLQKHGSLPCS
jgi:hypothetical protein